MIDEATWWSIGGGLIYGAEVTSEIYTVDNGWQVFAPFGEPGIRSGSRCNLQLNQTHYFMTGGFAQGRDFLMVDISDEKLAKVTRLPETPVTTDYAPCAFLYNDDGSREIIISGIGMGAGGHTLIFSFETQTWRDGPSLPTPSGYAEGMQYGETILVAGGSYSKGQVHIYDIKNSGWTTLSQNLTFEGHMDAAFLVPDDALNCV